MRKDFLIAPVPIAFPAIPGKERVPEPGNLTFAFLPQNEFSGSDRNNEIVRVKTKPAIVEVDHRDAPP